MYEVNVLSLADETISGNMSMSKVVIDTGATESVSGIRAMARLIDSLWFPYDITIDQRPRFRFGNGEYQRATSHCMLTTAALGRVGFFLLDGGAEDTPPLVGAKTMRSRKAVISYHGDYIAHRTADGKWWAPGKHIADHWRWTSCVGLVGTLHPAALPDQEDQHRPSSWRTSTWR